MEGRSYMFPPITLTLYDKDDQPLKEYTRSVIPWGLLKKAVRLTDSFQEQPAAKKRFGIFPVSETVNAQERQMEAISQFVVDLFGNQFSVRQLEEGADMGEIMTVFQAVLQRASAVVKTNPTPPAPSKKKQ